ncbi:MAG: hypothetical protein Q8R28_05765 [Dehalococcoidia bacterium]|nr:hypothetical protein [Dehalococcoidia bacterium]
MNILRDRALEYYAKVRWMPPKWLAGPSARAWEDWYVFITKHSADPLHWTSARWSLLWRLPAIVAVALPALALSTNLMDLFNLALWAFWHVVGPVVWVGVILWVRLAKVAGLGLSEEELEAHPGGEEPI